MIYEVKNISYTYNGMPGKTLDRCSLTLEEGEVLSILGPNGAGKSTLLNCLCGLAAPQEGEIRLCGQNIRELSVKQIARLVGYVPQTHNPVFGYTVKHFVMMGCASKLALFQQPPKEEEERAMEILNSLGIAHIAEKPYTDISGGERQQATIARAVMQDPKVILFDEPTAHLDYGKQLVILRLIRQMADRGFAAVMTSHNPDHVLLLGGTAAVVTREGRLDKGPVEQVLTEDRMAQIYRTELWLRNVEELDRTVCVPTKL